jgi:cell division protease FtsH
VRAGGEVVAHHEMGHALVALALPGTRPGPEGLMQKETLSEAEIAAIGATLQRSSRA